MKITKTTKTIILLAFVPLFLYTIWAVLEQGQKAKEISSPENVARWSSIQKNIQSCSVTGAKQTHSLDVAVKLKDGSLLSAKESKIDDIWHVLETSKTKCGNIPLATE